MADWGCHGLNLPFRALNLGYPSAIEADVQGEICASYPTGVRIRFDFAARGALPPATLWWYDGGRLPPAEAVPKAITDFLGQIPDAGVLILGDKGYTFGEPHAGAQLIQLTGETQVSHLTNHPATRGIARTLPRVRGHMTEWLAACRTGDKAMPFSNFELAGQLTETVLSGVVALRAGKKLQWDGPAMRALNDPAAAPFIQAKYRPGWL